MRTIINKPVLATIFFVIVIVFGFYSLQNTPIELVPDPDQKLPSLKVRYNWYGATAEMMLKRVMLPAEEEIMSIKGVKKITSNAARDRCTITVEFSRSTKMNFAAVVLSERLNKLRKSLPSQVSRPFVENYVPEEFEKSSFFRIGVYGDMTIYLLKQKVDKEIVPHLKAINGVDDVTTNGGVDPEIKINTDLAKLQLFNITIDQILSRIRNYFYSKQSVTLKKTGNEITLSITESPDRIEELRDIVLRKYGEKKLLLKEVADVQAGYEDITQEQRFNGMPVIGVTIFKEPKVSSLKLAKKVRAKLQQLADRQKGSINFIIEQDESKSLSSSLTHLFKISALILVIIFVILMIIVRDIKASLLIFSSVFFSVFTTFTCIYLFKISLNLLTLSGLALGFGLFVDNAVVVFDSILRFREKGLNLVESAVNGAKTVILPVLSSTFTTIIVFFSFALFFKDRLKIYYLPLAYIIAISLLSSIVVSFVLIPSLTARINIKPRTNNIKIKKGKFFPFILKYPLSIIIPVILLFLFTFNVFKKEVSFGDFFRYNSDERIVVYMRFPVGSEFEHIKKDILKFEKVAVNKTYNKEVSTSINGTMGFIEIKFPKHVENSGHPYQLKQELAGLAANLAGVGVMVRGFGQDTDYFYFPDTNSYLSSSITIKGYNYERLLEFCNNLKDTMLKHRRIKEVKIYTEGRSFRMQSGDYFNLKIDRAKLTKLGMSPRYLQYVLRSFLMERGGSEEKMKFDGKELSLSIKSDGVKELVVWDIMNMNLRSPENVPFRLRDIATLKMVKQAGGIDREEQQYVASLNWDYMGSSKATKRYKDTLYKNLVVPTGFLKTDEEDMFKMTDEEEKQLWKAITVSLILIYLILGMLYENIFQPLLIMLSIPLALIGVFIAFVAMDYSFDSTAYIGVILLAGIVVNNAILLIDNINLHLRKTSKIVESIVIGTKERIRPIFMTSATTVLGMLPLVLLKEEGSNDIWSSLALCTVGGLTSSAILILVVMPIFYYLFYKFQRFVFKKS